MKLSIKSLVIAAALLKALCFLFVALLNLILPPYGGAITRAAVFVVSGLRSHGGSY